MLSNSGIKKELPNQIIKKEILCSVNSPEKSPPLPKLSSLKSSPMTSSSFPKVKLRIFID